MMVCESCARHEKVGRWGGPRPPNRGIGRGRGAPFGETEGARQVGGGDSFACACMT